ncbi:DUF4957 domain-containing protein [Pinibacter soli]|uniref:DUF4957 domain-containing protein n=1 Tax=Pinibacter soli TaxID=3044211 RepID=A0ABT6RF15_9BACT|nr:DUF4957 domain-containing protein [Pinibacter soli]MDI3321118.1 DUF4957 domain-containing protein [Pinibacter soli]
MRKIFNLIFLLSAIGMSFIACKKYNDWPTDSSYNRLFQPSTLTTSVDGITVTMKWKGMPSTNKYVVELSKDSLQFNPVVARFTGAASSDANGCYFVIPGPLDPLTTYSVRIKGEDTTNGTPDSHWVTAMFKTKSEQIMTNVPASDVTANSITWRWQTPNAVTHLIVNGVRYNISADEVATGAKTITGLQPKTSYSATLYNNANIRGSQTMSTTALVPVGPDVIYLGPSDDLAAKITALTSGDNKIFVLYQGSSYNLGGTAVAIPAGVSITIWGEEGPDRPVIYPGVPSVSATQLFTIPTSAGTIKFENIDLEAFANNNPNSGFKATYVLNQASTDPACNISKVVFENCKIRNFATTALRLQVANSIIDSVVVNNSIAYNTANGYGFIHISATGASGNKIKITNSTFYNLGLVSASKGIVYNDKVANTTVIQNCTFNNMQCGTNYFLTFGGLASNLTLGNIIIGNLTGKGMAAGPIVSINPSGSVFRTGDANFTANAISGISLFGVAPNNNSTDLFVDPTNGIFTTKPGFSLNTGVGDPRWF